MDARGDAARHRRRVAAAGADFENARAGTHMRRRHHQRDDIGLGDRLALADRQGPVVIGVRAKIGVDELLTRHGAHRVEHMRVDDASPDQAPRDHVLARARQIADHETPPERQHRRSGGPFQAAADCSAGALRMRWSKADRAAVAPAPMAMTICL